MRQATYRTVSRRRAGERGFVLLLVFAMAAGIAVMLYLEMPRIAFQHQRNKEAMLVDRGEQYKRALELYVKKYNKFPQTIDELEKPDNVRLLRRRYKDPMTGKDEWRLIHIDSAGQYVDSLVHKREEEKKERHLLESDVQGIGATAVSATDEQGGPSPFLQRTASDRISPGAPGGGGGMGMPPPDMAMTADTSRSGPPSPVEQEPMGGEAAPGAPGMPGLPGLNAPPAGAQPAEGAPMTAFGPGGRPGQPGVAGAAGSAGAAGAAGGGAAGSGGGFGFGGGGFGMSAGGGAQAQAQAPGPVASPFMPQAGGGEPNPQGPAPRVAPGAPTGAPAPPAQSGAAPAAGNEALRMIQNQLSRPAPQAAARAATGIGGQPAPGQGGQQQGQLAGGVAGVASQLDMEGIRVYNDRTNYKEWEFLADLQKARGGAGQGGQPGQPGQPGQGGLPGQPGRPGGAQAPGQGMRPGGAQGPGMMGPPPGGAGGGGGGFGFGGGGAAGGGRPPR